MPLLYSQKDKHKNSKETDKFISEVKNKFKDLDLDLV